MTKPALYGGTPARSEMLPPNYPGAVVMGEEEASQAVKSILAKSPFRYYGPDVQHEVQAFEDQLAKDIGVKYALGVTSCTAALIVALKAAGVGYGDKVIVPANTFIATAGAVVCANAVPVFADIDESMNMDPNDLERVYDSDVKAIITVSILGHPVDMDPIMEFAEKHNITVIEDIAQACGVKYKNRWAGSIGHIGVFSFQMNKILTSGEGGAVVTNDPVLFERAVRYHDQGIFREKDRFGIESDEQSNAFVGQNYRMSEVSGAILRMQWKKHPQMLATMRYHYDKIRAALRREVPNLQFRKDIDEAGDIGAYLGLLLPSVEKAKQFAEMLQAENINAAILYGGKPAYMIPQIYNQRTADTNNFPFDYPFENPVVYTEDLCPRGKDLIPRAVYIPISPILTEQDSDQIIEGIVKVFKYLEVNVG